MTIILDSLSPELTAALHKKAQQQGRRVEDVAVEALERALEVNGKETAKRRDLSLFRGTWVEDPAFDEAVKVFRQVDEEAKP